MNCLNHPDRPRVAFCQNCGKPLCAECARVVGSAVFCEPCLEARLAAASAAAGAAPFGAGPTTASVNYDTTPGAAGYTVTGTAEGVPYSVPGSSPLAGAPNPGLALLLGFIPGVGAMYNGQYAKGVVHLVIFAVLVSLTDQHAIFGMFVAGWVAYQAFEAYHTAKARRDHTPLPNPFGLNDLGERLGFGRAWGAGPGYTTSHISHAEPVPAAAPPMPPPSTPYQATPGSAAQAAYAAPFSSTNPNPYTGATYAGYPDPTVGAPWAAPIDGTVFPGGSAAGYSAPPMRRPSRFPIGAIVLIGLGVLFLIGNAGWMEGFPIHRLLPFLLIGLGVWIFTRKMLDTGAGLADDGTPGYRLRVYRALRGSIWVMLVGVLFLLDSFNILSWGRSWPLFIIVGGVVAILERTAYASASTPAYAAQAASPPPTGNASPGTSGAAPPVVPPAIVPVESSSSEPGEVS